MDLEEPAAVQPPYKCIYCGAPSWIDPSDQKPPAGYCHEVDHGSFEDWAEYNEP